MVMGDTVYTIGHSNHPMEVFVALLRNQGIEAIADVRSAPYSRYSPQFNKSQLEVALKDADMKYVFLGKELGARSEDPSCYKDGRVVYSRLAQTDLFRLGIDRLVNGSSRMRIAIMCAEKEPLECHRTILVSRVLAERGMSVQHILADGKLESHESAMLRLLDLMGLPHGDLFKSREAFIDEALERHELRIAYVEKEVNETIPEEGA